MTGGEKRAQPLRLQRLVIVWLLACAGCDGPAVEPLDASAPGGDAALDAAGDAAIAEDAGPRPECPAAGAHHGQTIEVEDEARAYFLYVPAAVRCDVPTALWVDFHGTAGAVPEEAYGLEAQVALAEREGFVLVRPRSRSSAVEGLGEIYRWDQNPGDLDRNVRFVEALVERLMRTFEIDPDRLYASGFSSGSNMTARMLGETRVRFSGFGPIAGGIFAPGYPLRPFEGESFRVYASTGYRDYLHSSLVELVAALRAGGVPEERIFVRESDAGHRLYDAQFEEMWAFFEDGTRPDPGVLDAHWVREETTTDRSLLDAEQGPDGALYAFGAEGVIVQRRPDGVWQTVQAASAGPTWTDACFTADGRALVVGEGHLATRATGESAFVRRPTRLPELGQPTFGYGYINAVACGPDGRAVLGGYWSALSTHDGGETFENLEIDFGGYSGQIAALSFGAHEHIAVGYAGIAAGAEPHLARLAWPPTRGEWMTDVHETDSGAVLIVSDGGEVFRATDRRTFQRVADTEGPALYAIAAHGNEVLAVGAQGAAFYSDDDGQHFTRVDAGLDAFLGGVRFLGPGEAIAVGEGGLALRFTAP